MISSGKENFFAAHYDWLAAAFGFVALVAAGAFFAMALGEDSEEAASEAAQGVDRMKPGEIGVKPLDLSDNLLATRLTRNPATIAEVPEKAANFLASERRVMCKCGRAISGNVKAVPKCPFCGEKQEEEQVVVVDADGDQLPDEWEKRFGLNPNDPSDAVLDTDGDGFTNLEEYLAKTDPTNKDDHPDYLDSVKILLPLKQTYLPFVFTKASQVPGGWRCEFFDASKKDVKRGSTGFVTAKVGEEVSGYGLVVKKYEAKTEKRERKGMKGMLVSVDVSEVTLERKADGKQVVAVIGSPKGAKPVPMDVQATLAYERGTVRNIEVVPGAEIDLSGAKYRVVSVVAAGKGAKVTFQDVQSGKKRTIEALEQ